MAQDYAIIVDRSASMSLGNDPGDDSGSSERGTRYAHFLDNLRQEQEALNKLNESHIVEWFDLDGPTTYSSLELPPVGEQTSLMELLSSKPVKTQAGASLAGIVLVSDGADNNATYKTSTIPSPPRSSSD
ncbi:MAG: hypothetical protein R3C68_09275 [Myxococcota bacterium]